MCQTTQLKYLIFKSFQRSLNHFANPISSSSKMVVSLTNEQPKPQLNELMQVLNLIVYQQCVALNHIVTCG